MSESETPFYDLPLYETGSVANLRDDYNRAMQRIDQVLNSLDFRITTLERIHMTSKDGE